MKDSKEHRISNLKDMINNVKEEDEEVIDLDDIEEDSELIEYLNKDNIDYDKLEIDDEFIYHPNDENDHSVDLEENPIDEEFIIKAPKSKEIEDDDEKNEMNNDIAGEISENFDNVINAKIKGRPILAIVGTVLGVIFLIISVFIFQSRSDRVIDNVVAGESSFMFVIFAIVGLFLTIYGIYKLFNIKNPFENITNSIDSIDNWKKDKTDKKDETEPKKDTPSQKPIPKSNIPLDKDSFKIGEFNLQDLKSSLKKSSNFKKDKTPVEDDINDIPPAKEKSPKKKGLTAEEIENIEYEQAQLENESIDDIFAEVEDIEDMPIISVNSKEEK